MKIFTMEKQVQVTTFSHQFAEWKKKNFVFFSLHLSVAFVELHQKHFTTYFTNNFLHKCPNHSKLNGIKKKNIWKEKCLFLEKFSAIQGCDRTLCATHIRTHCSSKREWRPESFMKGMKFMNRFYRTSLFVVHCNDGFWHVCAVAMCTLLSV